MRLRILPSGATLSLAGDARVLDVLDESAELGLPTACRAANCGICRVRVLAGADTLQPSAARERQTLAALGAAPDVRLGCQLRTRPDVGDELLIIEPVIRLPL